MSAPPIEPATGPPSPRPNRLATPSWLDLRLVLGVVLVLGSVVVGAKVVSGASRTRATVTTTRDLAAGTVLTRSDVTLSQVQLPDGNTDRYLTSADHLVGKRLIRPVSRGELLPAAAVTAVRAQTTLTVPLAAGAAPQLRTGQRIELWVSSATCASVVLLPEVIVQSAHPDDGNSFGGGAGAQNVVIDVDPSRADRVIQALALDGATVRAGVLVGGSGTVRPTAAPSGAPGQGGRPSDLAACASASPTR